MRFVVIQQAFHICAQNECNAMLVRDNLFQMLQMHSQSGSL